MKCNSIKLSWTMLGLESLWKCWSSCLYSCLYKHFQRDSKPNIFQTGFVVIFQLGLPRECIFQWGLSTFPKGVGTKFAKSVKQIFTNSKGVILMIVHTGGGVDIKWNIHEIQQGQLNKMTKVPSGSYIELLSSHMPILMQTLYIITLYHLQCISVNTWWCK